MKPKARCCVADFGGEVRTVTTRSLSSEAPQRVFSGQTGSGLKTMAPRRLGTHALVTSVQMRKLGSRDLKQAQERRSKLSSRSPDAFFSRPRVVLGSDVLLRGPPPRLSAPPGTPGSTVAASPHVSDSGRVSARSLFSLTSREFR